MDDIKTHAERKAQLDFMEQDDQPLYHNSKKLTAAQRRAHIERLRLIYKPFPAVRRLGTGSAMPWAGTIVADTFYGVAREVTRKRPERLDRIDMDQNEREWDDYTYYAIS